MSDPASGVGASSVDPARVIVYWRPGCGYCSRLRRGLRRARVVTEEIDIWSDAQGAATVRSINAGDETVPTVVVGVVTLTNPTVREVLDELGRHLRRTTRG